MNLFNYYPLPCPSSAGEDGSLNVNCRSLSSDLHLPSWITPDLSGFEPSHLATRTRHILPLVQLYGRNFLSGCFKQLSLKFMSGLAKSLPDMRLIGELSRGQGADHSTYVGEPCQEETLRAVHSEKGTVGPQESQPIPI